MAALLALTAMVLGLSGCASAGRPRAVRVNAATDAAAAEPGSPAGERAATGLATTPDRPTALAIPAIGVRSGLEALRREPSGQLAVPRDPARAGWYVDSAVPGEVGPAVIVGHIDSRDGPAVFARLAALRAGDTVVVRRSDGQTARFRITAVRRYAKARFPTAQVYGPQPTAALRLITCGGRFDRAAQRYQDNVIAFATAA